MDEIEFFKLAIGNYLIDCNAMDLCIDNYFPGSEERSLSENVIHKDSNNNMQKLPSFFKQYEMLLKLYERLNSDGAADFENVIKKLDELRENKYNEFLNIFNQISNADLNLIFQNSVIKMRKDYKATEIEARLLSYFEVLKNVRDEEIINNE